MDAGWVIYGVLLNVGVLLTFNLRKGPLPIIATILAIVTGVGVALVGFFQGSNADVANGLIAFHTSGAQAVMIAGNVMAVLVGAAGSRIGWSRGRSIALIVLGVVGLVAFPPFLVDVFSGAGWNIGLFERAVIYPIMAAHVLTGSGIIATRRLARAATAN